MPKNSKLFSVLLMVGFLVMSSCGDSRPPSFVSGPKISPNPNPAVPLAAVLECSTDEPSQIVLIVSNGKEEREISVDQDFATDHRLPILGLAADMTHTIRVRAVDPAGNWVEAKDRLEHTTPSLPDDFPPLSVQVSNMDRMEPGVTLFEITKRIGNKTDRDFHLILAVNPHGEVVWYYRPDHSTRNLHILSSGNLLYLSSEHRATEVTLTGKIVRQWHAVRYPNDGNELDVPEGSIPVDVETFHHEILRMASGNFLVLSTELRVVDNFPTDLKDPGSPREKANIIGDVVVEFQPDGAVVNRWNLLDLLDPDRYGYSSADTFWEDRGYGHIEGGTQDWGHANSVFYNQPDDSIIVSVRHQDAVIKFSRQTGDLIWILGTHAGWGDRWKAFLLNPVGELEWQFHQHAARITRDGLLLLFDNGNYRAWPPEAKTPDREAYSRAVEFKIGEEQRTVEQVWLYGGPGPDAFFSSFVSEADLLPLTGNVLVTEGGRTRNEKGEFASGPEATRYSARIVEVTHSEPPEIVFELLIEDPSAEDPIGWMVYRSERLPDLYPNR